MILGHGCYDCCLVFAIEFANWGKSVLKERGGLGFLLGQKDRVEGRGILNMASLLSKRNSITSIVNAKRAFIIC
jgi:hypothetical protein